MILAEDIREVRVRDKGGFNAQEDRVAMPPFLADGGLKSTD